MKNWTREERYRTLSESDRAELEALHDQIRQSSWRTGYHVQTVTGLMNDPNGFAYYNGKWNLFYQWFPYGAVHGMKHWYRVESIDLLHWKNCGCALKPGLYEDNKGCYSGSAYSSDGKLYLTYTGNCRDSEWNRIPYQIAAVMDTEGKIVKTEEPIITPQKGYTEHQRDPKLFVYEGKYYILLGAQNDAGEGKFLLYRSEEITKGWEFLGELKVRGYESFGFMVECPDIEKIGDKWVLLFSPQGLESERFRFRNKFNNVYFIGDLDLENLEFIPDGPFEELDRGFDFYAAQCAEQKLWSDRAIMTGWFGVSDYLYPPTDAENWSGLLTLARELTIKDGKLLQKPVMSTRSLRKEVLFEAVNGEIRTDQLQGRMPSSCIIRIEDPEHESIRFNLMAANGRRGFEISYDRNNKRLVIDRSGMMRLLNTEYGNERTVVVENGLSSLEIFCDNSTIEIFVNDGEFVLSSRVFPLKEEHMIRMGGKDINITLWQAEKTVEDDFVI